jgi:hypothetical protein
LFTDTAPFYSNRSRPPGFQISFDSSGNSIDARPELIYRAAYAVAEVVVVQDALEDAPSARMTCR